MSSLLQRAYRVVRRGGFRIQAILDQWLADLSQVEHPGWPVRTADDGIYRFRRRLLLFLEGSEGRAEWWSGREVASGRPFRVLYIGDMRAYKVHSPQYLQHVLFEPGSVQVEEAAALPLRQVPRLACELGGDADLVITEGNSARRWVPSGAPPDAWRISPIWMRMVFHFTPGQTWPDVERAMRSQKNNIKLGLRTGYTCRFTTADADFDFFYERMHAPMIEKRHSGYGLVDSKDGMRQQFHRGNLLLVENAEGRPIAGQMHVIHGKLLMAIANGYLDGDERLYSQGVISLIYYSAIRWAFENGFQYYDAGGVRPFLSDGLYFYKIRWGLQPARDPWMVREWLFWAPRGSSVALDWLREHPPVPEKDAPIPTPGPRQAPAPAANALLPVTGQEREKTDSEP